MTSCGKKRDNNVSSVNYESSKDLDLAHLSPRNNFSSRARGRLMSLLSQEFLSLHQPYAKFLKQSSLPFNKLYEEFTSVRIPNESIIIVLFNEQERQRL